MSRNLRKRGPRRESPNRMNTYKTKCTHELEEVFTRTTKREKAVVNRCCFFSPEQRDFGQNTNNGNYMASSSPVTPVKLMNNYTEQSEVVLTNTSTQPCEQAEIMRNNMYTESFEEAGLRLINNYTGQDEVLRADICTSPLQQAEVIRTSDYTQSSKQNEQYKNLLAEQYGFNPTLPETITQIKELKKVLCNIDKVEESSQYPKPNYVETCDGSQWQNVDRIEDIDKLITTLDGKGTESPILYDDLPTNIYISDVPRVKIIAEKFSKYKRNNIELRRLDEKVVCVEYDIYDQASNGDILKPVQKMRAFFSIKPTLNDSTMKGGGVPELPSKIKRNFNIKDEDLKKLTEQEIEIIDGNIEQNKSYLEDFRRILKRKRVINAKKNKSSLDLQSLYDMARKDRSPLDCDFSNANLLSKAELQEVKDLILQRCASSVHGISRRKVKRNKGGPVDVNVLSDSIIAELLREDTRFHV